MKVKIFHAGIVATSGGPRPDERLLRQNMSEWLKEQGDAIDVVSTSAVANSDGFLTRVLLFYRER